MNAKRIESSRAGVLRLLHSREKAEAVDVEMVEERKRFKYLAGEGPARFVSAPDLYQTPVGLADRMARELGDRWRILEPSAGLGRLYDAVRKVSGAEMVLVELAADCCAELYRIEDHAVKLVQEDFLRCDRARLGGPFDGVIMNPPFGGRADMRHVVHAYGMLDHGGRLVAVMSEGPFFRQDRKSAAFRDWLEDVGGLGEKLPPQSFKDSGTGVNVRLVVIDKV